MLTNEPYCKVLPCNDTVTLFAMVKEFTYREKKKQQLTNVMSDEVTRPEVPLRHFRVYYLTKHGEMKVKSDVSYPFYYSL